MAAHFNRFLNPINVVGVSPLPVLFAGSHKSQGVSGIVMSNTSDYDAEQLSACLDCGAEYVTVFKAQYNLKLEKSTSFEADND